MRCSIVVRSTAIAFLGLLSVGVAQAAGVVSLNTMGSAYTEDFNTLALSGTSSVVPTGWDFMETGTNANTIYTAGSGTSTTGDTYSFGATAATDRALGGLLSGSLTPTVGAAFLNNTGFSIGVLSISYTGEEWRLGTTARRDRLDFQYSTDATSLSTGTWIDVDALDFLTPDFGGVAGARDGNSASDRLFTSFSLGGLAIPGGSTFWIRWADFNASGADDGLSVDDFSLTPDSSPVPTENTTWGAIKVLYR